MIRTRLAAATIALAAPAGATDAQIFEVQHPDVEAGGFEVEVLTGVTLGDVEEGDERAANEIALGYAPTGFWKTKAAVEVAWAEGDGYELEAFEWENVFLAPFGAHAHGEGHDAEDESFFEFGALALYVALEVPREGGIGSGAVEVGPIVEIGLGPVETIANLFVEVPFEDGEDPGLGYALGASVPVAEFEPVALAAGFEAHGSAEGAFGDALPLGENTHVLGPALYTEVDAGRGRVIEPRLAILFGLTDGSPDAVASFNVELKF